jgi:hypothetical protein
MAVDLVDPELKTEREDPMPDWNLDQIILEAKIAVDRERKRPGSGVGISTSRYDKSTQGTMRVPAALVVELIEGRGGLGPGAVSKAVADEFKSQRDLARAQRDAESARNKELLEAVAKRSHQLDTLQGGGTPDPIGDKLRAIASTIPVDKDLEKRVLKNLLKRQADGFLEHVGGIDWGYPATSTGGFIRMEHDVKDVEMPVGKGPVIVNQDARHVPDGYTMVTHRLAKPAEAVNECLNMDYMERLKTKYEGYFATQELQQQPVDPSTYRSECRLKDTAACLFVVCRPDCVYSPYQLATS